MGREPSSTTPGQSRRPEELVAKFARLMRERYGARLYLFGSRVTGTAIPDSDYDLVAVARDFGEQRPTRRALDRNALWNEAGGWGIELDLHCYTPEEFREELAGLGYLGQARRRGELLRVRVRDAA